MYNSRITKKVAFLQVRDGTGIIQVIVGAADVSRRSSCARSLTQETSVRVTGTVQADPRSPIGFELRLSALDVIARPAQEFPISPRSMARLPVEQPAICGCAASGPTRSCPSAPRSSGPSVTTSTTTASLVDAPIFTPNACEGTSTLFR
ncbi:MAG: OB-fold nucleic acid binding domain-containing protein [bacterium]